MMQAGSQVMGTSGTMSGSSTSSVVSLAGASLAGFPAVPPVALPPEPPATLPPPPAVDPPDPPVRTGLGPVPPVATGGVRFSRQPSAAPAITAHITIRNTSVSFLMASPRHVGQ
jgi:hypothetical protein